MIWNWFLHLVSGAIAWTVHQVLMAAELHRLQRETERQNRENEQLRGRAEIVEKRLPEALASGVTAWRSSGEITRAL